MLRGFFLIFILCGIALVAVFGFRGHKSGGSPLEVFPDMVRQQKVRAQAPSGFFADGRGSRLPVNGTIPIGYELPKAQAIASPSAPVAIPPSHNPLSFSEGSDYYNSGKMGNSWGTGMPTELAMDAAFMERGRERF